MRAQFIDCSLCDVSTSTPDIDMRDSALVLDELVVVRVEYTLAIDDCSDRRSGCERIRIRPSKRS